MVHICFSSLKLIFCVYLFDFVIVYYIYFCKMMQLHLFCHNDRVIFIRMTYIYKIRQTSSKKCELESSRLLHNCFVVDYYIIVSLCASYHLFSLNLLLIPWICSFITAVDGYIWTDCELFINSTSDNILLYPNSNLYTTFKLYWLVGITCNIYNIY